MKEDMDEGKRKLLKALPPAAIAPALLFSVGEKEAQGFELAPTKKYVFRINAHLITQDDVDKLSENLRGRGINATVISGDVEIYELT